MSESVLAFSIGLCAMWVQSDQEHGGYKVRCGRHGVIATRNTLAEAEGTGHLHGRKWQRIDKIHRR